MIWRRNILVPAATVRAVGLVLPLKLREIAIVRSVTLESYQAAAAASRVAWLSHNRRHLELDGQGEPTDAEALKSGQGHDVWAVLATMQNNAGHVTQDLGGYEIAGSQAVVLHGTASVPIVLSLRVSYDVAEVDLLRWALTYRATSYLTPAASALVAFPWGAFVAP